MTPMCSCGSVGGPSPYLLILFYSISASFWVNVYTYREKEKESDDSYYLYHPTTGVDLPPFFSASLLCKTMDYVWYAYESCIQVVCFCMHRCMLETLQCALERKRGEWGCYIHLCMHVCIHAETPFISLSFFPSPSIMHPQVYQLWE